MTAATGAAADRRASAAGVVGADRRVAAADVVATVLDPELPMVTLAELGMVRDVREAAGGEVLVAITPTYSGCPAMATIRDDVVAALRAAGYERAEVRTVLSPAWTTDWISESGRAKLAAAGIAPPGPAPRRGAGPVPLVLGARMRSPAPGAVTPRPSGSPRSAPRRAASCAAAPPVGNRSST